MSETRMALNCEPFLILFGVATAPRGLAIGLVLSVSDRRLTLLKIVFGGQGLIQVPNHKLEENGEVLWRNIMKNIMAKYYESYYEKY